MTEGPLLVRIVARACRILIRLCPREFRRLYGGDLALTLEDVFREAWSRGGAMRLLRTGAAVLGDLLATAVRARSAPRGRREQKKRREVTMDFLMHDFRLAVRRLRREPLFALIVVATLGIGIGASTALFSIVDRVLIRPLPYPNPDRLVALWETIPARGRSRIRPAPANYLDWREGMPAFAAMAAFRAAGASLTGDGEPEWIRGARVTASYFDVLGVQPLLGRAFLPEEDEPRGKVLILSYELWQRRYGGSPDVLGRVVSLDDESHNIVGVMPPGVYPSSPTASGRMSFETSALEFWAPFELTPRLRASRGTHILGVVGRLESDVSLERAQGDAERLARRLEEEYRETNEGETIIVRPLMDEVVGDVRPALLVLLGAVGLVLLVACANVANLFLARFLTRETEFAVRAALGAERMRLLRQAAAESLLLALSGGALGIALAVFGVEAVKRFGPQGVPRLADASVDARVMGFTLAVSLGAALLLALVPAVSGSQWRLFERLRPGSSLAGADRARIGLRRLLAVSELALAAALASNALLLGRSFLNLLAVDLGFGGERLLAVEVTLPASRYVKFRQVTGFYDSLLDHLRASPGVAAAATAYDHPLESNWINGFSIEGRPASRPGEEPSGRLLSVSDGYLETSRIPLLRGRVLGREDDARHPGAALVNESLVRRYFVGEEPLGKRIRTPVWSWAEALPESFEIVGVVKDVHSLGPRASAEPTFYLPFSQFPIHDMTLLVRSEGDDPKTLVPIIRDAVQALDPQIPLGRARTMDEHLSEAVAQPRFSMGLIGAFSAVALALAAIGVYGVFSFEVARRRREIGLRMALGARPGEVRRLVVGQALRWTAGGIVAGLFLSLALGRLMTSLLFGVRPDDAVTMALVSATLVLVGLAASYIPARRASRIDPLGALRAE